jgi:hypothetical protein
MLKLILNLYFVLLGLSCFAQDIQPAERLVLSDTLVFMGIDMGMARMVYPDPEVISKGAYIRDKHGPAWDGIDDAMVANKNLPFDLSKKKVIPMPLLFDQSHTKLPDDWVMNSYLGISQEAIREHVKQYPTFVGRKLGFVFIIDKLEKNGRQSLVRMYGVYIDLRDNSVIKTLDCSGYPDGIGYTSYWATGIYNAYKNFLTRNDEYIPRLKRYFKKHKEE